VSYLKSGNTWVRFLIANLIKTSDDHIDFHTAVKYVPEIGIHNDEISRLSRPRIINKSCALHHYISKSYIYSKRCKGCIRFLLSLLKKITSGKH